VSRTVRIGGTAGALLTAGIWLLAACALLSGCTYSQQVAASADPDPGGYHGGTSVPEPYRLPDKTLTDTWGRPYNLVSSPSKPVLLLFFGYSHCPDVCNTVLADIASALTRMSPADRDQVQLVFITTDPARDTPKVVGKYLGRFNPSFVGLTGDLGTIKAVAGRVGVDIEGMQKLPSGGYEVGHSAQVIGFDRQRRGVVFWTPETPIADLKYDFGLLLDRSR
jgi:protein SCO1/2